MLLAVLPDDGHHAILGNEELLLGENLQGVIEAQTLLEQIRDLDGDFEFETYYSLSCHNCPDVVQALNLMAVLNPRIKHTAIDGGVFQNEITDRNVMGVPAVFVNGKEFGQGRMTLAEIVAKVDTGAEKRAAEELNKRDAYDVLIVGSGPAGAAAAVYSARKGIRTGLMGERFGGQILDTVDIENYISVPKTEGQKLAGALKVHVDEYDVDVIDSQSASKLIPAAQEGGLHEDSFPFFLLYESAVYLACSPGDTASIVIPQEALPC